MGTVAQGNPSRHSPHRGDRGMAGWEQRVFRLAVAFGQPLTQEGNGLTGQGRAASLASLAQDSDVVAGAEVGVAHA